MIWDSSHWKDGLIRTATRLDEIAVRRRPSEKLLVELEQAVFLAAYGMRKLMDAQKISTEHERRPVSVRAYPAKGKPVTLKNWHRIDDLYDFASSRDTTLCLRDFCNQLIHSYVFIPLTTSKTGPVKAVLFSSDRQRNVEVYEIPLATLADVLRAVGADYPACSEFTFDSNMGDYRIRNWTPAE